MSDRSKALETEQRDTQKADRLLGEEELAAPGTPAAAEASRWAKLSTLSAYVCIGTYAICLSMIGPTIPNLQVLLDTDLKRLSWSYTVKCVGNIAGGVLVGFLFSRVNHELTFMLASVVCCVSMCVAPVTGSVYGFIFALGGLGLTGGVYNAGGTVYIINLWKGSRRKRPATLAFHLFFSMGAFLGPLLARPFLVPVIKASSNSTGRIADAIHNHTDDTWIVRNSPGNEENVTLVVFAYVTVGLVALLGGFLFLCVHLKKGGALLKRSQPRTWPSQQEEGARGCQQCSCELFHVVVLSGLFLSLLFSVITFHIPGSLMASFVVVELDWTVADGSFLTALYYGSFCLGRLVGVPVSLVASPRTMLVCGMSVTTGGFVVILFVCHLHPVYLYVSVAAVGVGISPIIGSLYVWTSNHITLSGRETGFVQCGFGLGEMIAQPLTAYLFETYTPMWLIYISIAASALAFAVFSCVQILVVSCCRQRQTSRSLVI